MAIVLEEANGSSFTFGGASTKDVTFASAPSADEIVMLFYSVAGASSAASSFSWGTGFTEFLAPSAIDGEVQLAGAWKRAGGSESDTYTVNWTAGAGGNERILGFRFSGCITSGSPIDDTGYELVTFPGTSYSAGDLTASVANTHHCMLLTSNGNLSGPTSTGYAETVYNQAFGGNSFGMDARAFFDDGIASSGATGSKTISQSGGGFFNVTTFSFLLLPDSGGGGGTDRFRRRESGLLAPARPRIRYY